VSRNSIATECADSQTELLGNFFSSSDFLELHGPGKVGVQISKLSEASQAKLSELK
jgi:hypothetical protein